MAEDDSNDVMCLDSNDGYTTEDFDLAANDKPLMTLFKRLIGNDSKENTVLTNAQIIDILKKEFDMDISYIHDLELEIYLNLMKKFLKDWPLWDEFDQSIQILKNRNDTASIKKKLETNHENLKNYLSKWLDAAKPFMKDVVDSTIEATSKERGSENTESDVILEIHCTRQQLNQLFYRRPHPDLKNTIFNVQIPNKITVNSISLRALLNWPGVRLNVKLGPIIFVRDSVHTLKHKLVNKKLNYAKEETSELTTNLQMKDVKPLSTFYTLKHLANVFSVFSDSRNVSADEKRFVEEIYHMIDQDFESACDVNISPVFRRTLNKYPYVRYLYSEVNTKEAANSNLYDLQLEETMTPMFHFNILKFESVPEKIEGKWLTVVCLHCNVSFCVSDNSMGLWEHFESNHQGEPDWQCTNCNKSFNMVALAENRWGHDCEQQTENVS